MQKAIFAGVGGLWLSARLGLLGETEVKLCPHETYEIETGLFTNSLVFQPKDCYLKVKQTSFRPFNVTIEEEECCGFGEECMGYQSPEEEAIMARLRLERLDRELDRQDREGSVKLVLTPKGIQPGIEITRRD